MIFQEFVLKINTIFHMPFIENSLSLFALVTNEGGVDKIGDER